MNRLALLAFLALSLVAPRYQALGNDNVYFDDPTSLDSAELKRNMAKRIKATKIKTVTFQETREDAFKRIAKLGDSHGLSTFKYAFAEGVDLTEMVIARVIDRPLEMSIRMATMSCNYGYHGDTLIIYPKFERTDHFRFFRNWESSAGTLYTGRYQTYNPVTHLVTFDLFNESAKLERRDLPITAL
ncbi:MAG: hypothetical protein AAF226_10570, partial [Verrucomicrobiota bacterium]